MNGGPEAEEAVTMAQIMDCPTVTVHALVNNIKPLLIQELPFH